MALTTLRPARVLLLGIVLLAAAALPFAARSDGAPGPAQQPSGAMLQQMQSAMMADPEIMNQLTRLASNPDMQRALADPDLMRAVQAGDLATLQDHPTIKRLMADPQMQGVARHYSADGS